MEKERITITFDKFILQIFFYENCRQMEVWTQWATWRTCFLCFGNITWISLPTSRSLNKVHKNCQLETSALSHCAMLGTKDFWIMDPFSADYFWLVNSFVLSLNWIIEKFLTPGHERDLWRSRELVNMLHGRELSSRVWFTL